MRRAFTIDLDYLTEQGIVEVRTSGVLPSSSWPEVIRASMDEGDRRSCVRYLVDHRKARFRFRFADMVNLPKIAASFPLAPNARIAILPPRGLERGADFIEAIMSNRGINLRIFVDRDEAIAWLADHARPNILSF